MFDRSNLPELGRKVMLIVIAFYITFSHLPGFVESDSMAPAFHSNDVALVDRSTAFALKVYRAIPFDVSGPRIEAGDAVTIKNPNRSNGANHLKRVFAKGEGIVTESDGELEFTPAEDFDTIDTDRVESSWHVGESEIFVLGDNRSISRDSRHYGTVQIGDVTGIVRAVIGSDTFFASIIKTLRNALLDS